jgi:hypothetical protein
MRLGHPAGRRPGAARGWAALLPLALLLVGADARAEVCASAGGPSDQVLGRLPLYDPGGALDDRYDGGGYSGGTLERPALQRLIRDVEAGRVDTGVCYKIDRLSRSLTDFRQAGRRVRAEQRYVR